MPATTKITDPVVVVLSGGQDSTTCLGWANNRYENVYAVTFDYGQRHRIEIDAARKVADLAKVREHKILTISTFSELGGNALTANVPISVVENKETSLPNTFVPGRNLIFLTLAAAWAYQIKAHHLVTGVCQTDYSGYPDCRDNTIMAQNLAINLGMDCNFKIHTPLMWLTKAESIEMAVKEGCLQWLAWSHTCYNGSFPPCETCAACKIRSNGFEIAKIKDPLLTRQR